MDPGDRRLGSTTCFSHIGAPTNVANKRKIIMLCQVEALIWYSRK